MPRTLSNADQAAFDFLVPYSERRTLLNPKEVAICLGRSIYFVYDMIDEGKLEAHAPANREQARYMITRRSVILLLAEQANYDAVYFAERVTALLKTLTRAQLDAVLIEATRLRARL